MTGALSPLSFSLSPLSIHSNPNKSQILRNTNSSTKPSFFPYNCNPSSINLPSRQTFSLCNISGNEDKIRSSDESLFLDEDGVVEDMDGYLNSLSLEYDSVWDTKPSWCQPWTIMLTGATVVACSWLFFHSVTVSAGVSTIICAWWYIFLYAYPKAYSEMIAERKKKVTSGIEDTFGVKRSR